MLNQSKPTTTLSNTEKASAGVTWTTITTTWATEPRTWEAVSQIISNSSRVVSGITNAIRP